LYGVSGHDGSAAPLHRLLCLLYPIDLLEKVIGNCDLAW
jgi:hypothetical protein